VAPLTLSGDLSLSGRIHEIAQTELHLHVHVQSVNESFHAIVSSVAASSSAFHREHDLRHRVVAARPVGGSTGGRAGADQPGTQKETRDTTHMDA
jgi:hypothetical protein